MAGKIEGAAGIKGGSAFFQGPPQTNEIPTAMWEAQNVFFRPETAGAAFAGVMLKQEYDKSRAANAGLKP